MLNYLDHGDKIQMMFNFYANQHLFLALAREQAEPIRRAYAALPPLSEICQWTNFLRNHDELDLARLEEAERGAQHYTRILEALALSRADGDVPLGALVNAEAKRFGRHTTVVVITPSTSEEWVGSLQ